MAPEPTKEELPPERDFDQSTAWELLEAAAAEAIADLPNFPGFYQRGMNPLECSHAGAVDGEYINLELSYRFSVEDSGTELTRSDYLDLLRDRWSEAGYDIHRDRPSGTGKDHSLEARRPDGINYWYDVSGYVSLKVQSGCIKAVEGGDYIPDCPTPLGGVTRENDLASKYCSDINTVYPEESPTEAIDPFATPSGESESPSPAGMVPWARQPDPAESGPSSYEGQL
jgi:hypothetical protein